MNCFLIEPRHLEVQRKARVTQNYAKPKERVDFALLCSTYIQNRESDAGGSDGDAKGKNWLNPGRSVYSFGTRQLGWSSEPCRLPAGCILRNAIKDTLGSAADGHFGSVALPGALPVCAFKPPRRPPPSLPDLRALRPGLRRSGLVWTVIVRTHSANCKSHQKVGSSATP